MIQKLTKSISALMLIFICLNASAQNADTTRTENLLKVNLTSLFLKNFSVQYERAIGKKIAAGIGFRFMPQSGLPLQSTFEDAIDDPETVKQLNSFKTGNFAITPEVRFYMGKDVFRGFYIAPFVRYARYTAKMPFDFTVNNTTETIQMEGNMTTLTAGLQLGVQWKLSKAVYLDLMILGPQYGSSSGSIAGKKPLTTQEQTELRNELEDLDIPIVRTTTTVDANGATLDFDGPWAGLRAGINLGIRF